MTTTVLVVDDHATVRAGIAAMIDSDARLSVVGQAGDGEHAVHLAASLHPDLVVMDIRMPRMDGIEATRRIVAEHPSTRVLVLTTFDLDEYVHAALRAGASGFLLKDATAAELLHAARLVADGEALLAPAATRTLITHYLHHAPDAVAAPRAVGRLTARERDVLRAVGQGLSNTEIATAFTLSPNTVKSHVSRLLAKLGVRDRAQAVIAAYEAGLVRVGADPRSRPDAGGRVDWGA